MKLSKDLQSEERKSDDDGVFNKKLTKIVSSSCLRIPYIVLCQQVVLFVGCSSHIQGYFQAFLSATVFYIRLSFPSPPPSLASPLLSPLVPTILPFAIPCPSLSLPFLRPRLATLFLFSFPSPLTTRPQRSAPWLRERKFF